LQLKNQVKNDLFNRTFEQIRRLEDREFRLMRKFISEKWDGKYPVVDEETDIKIREFSHTMDTIGVLYCKSYLDKNLIIELYGPFIVNAWYRCRSFAESIEIERGIKRYQEVFIKVTFAI
jgi:hypothetical protein